MKTPIKPNAEKSAKVFGCTLEQARVMFRRNAYKLMEMHAKAMKTGKKVNGYTAEELEQSAKDYLEAAQ